MKTFVKVVLAFAAGTIAAQPHTAFGELSKESPANRTYLVTIDEIVKTHVPSLQFSETYRTVLITADGKERTIELTPVLHKGKQLMRVTDSGSTTYIALDGAVRNGNLRIQTRDKRAFDEKMKSEGW